MDHNLISTNLEKYGFGPDFMQLIKTLLQHKKAVRWIMANLILKPVGGRSSIFLSNLSMSKLIKKRTKKLPLFNVDAINLLMQFSEVEDLTSNDVMSQHLWATHVYLNEIHH